MEERAQTKGIFDLTNRIAKVLLNRPSFKTNLATFLNHIDPDSVPELVRTLIWEDVGVLLSVADAIPNIANALIKGVEELVQQLDEKFPPEFLRELVRIIAADIDMEAVANIKIGFGNILAELLPLLDNGTENKTMPEKGGEA